MDPNIIDSQIQADRGQADSYLSEIAAKLLGLSANADIKGDRVYAAELEALVYKVQIAQARLKRA